MGQGSLMRSPEVRGEEAACEGGRKTQTTKEVGAEPTIPAPKRCGRPRHDDLQLSAYACTHCGLTFDQLFSFNSAAGDVLRQRPWRVVPLDPTFLVPDGQLFANFKDGCLRLLGPSRDLGR